jgi:uncharacterized protein YaaW (UPF0174 family)
MKNPVFDKDLTSLLRNSSNEELDPIVQLILAAPSQTLTIQKAYRDHTGDHQSYVDELVYEITSFGGNSIANLVRGHGISYAEMVRDVAKRLLVSTSITDTVETLEEKIILKILKLSYDRMEVEDRIALGQLINLSVKADNNGHSVFPEEEISAGLASSASTLMGDRIQNAIDIASHSAKIRQTVVAGTRSILMKLALIPLGGPISWSMAAGQAIYDLFGPSFSRSLSLISQIGLLRHKSKQAVRDRIDQEMEDEVEAWAEAHL